MSGRSLMFEPIRIGQVTLRNRVTASPMDQYSAVDGVATGWHEVHYGGLLASGLAAVIMEFAAVEADGRISPGCLGIWSDRHAEALARIIDWNRRFGDGALLGIQLAHCGRKGSVSRPWEEQKPILAEAGGWPIRGPDRNAYPGRQVPHALSVEEMEQLKTRFVEAAVRVRDIGMDWVELHCAHGYLLNQFLSPLSNARTDAYGGDLENRMKYPLEIFSEIRRVWPADRILGVRISAVDWVAGGWTMSDSVAFSRRLKELGCDYVTCSSGGVDPGQKIDVRPGYQVSFAETLKKEAGMQSIAVGLITQPQQAETILTSGQADLVALGRCLMYEPRWMWRAALELRESIAYPPQYLRAHPLMRYGNSLEAIFR